MTGACPPGAELARLLADQLTAEEAALDVDVPGCAACQRRLDQLTCVVWTLPVRQAASRAGQQGLLERLANLIPAQVRLLPQQDVARRREDEESAAPSRFSIQVFGPRP